MTSKYDKEIWKKKNLGAFVDQEYRLDRRVAIRNTDRVHFKNKNDKKKNKHKDWSSSLRAHFQDEDIDMSIPLGGEGSSRGWKKGPHRGKGGGSSFVPPGKRKLFESPSNWYRVTLPYGNNYEKDFLIKSIGEKVSPLHFWPITWEVNGNIVTFYVDDFKVAEKIHGCDRQIPMPDNYKLLIRVHGGSPNIDITSDLKNKMKEAMASRYNPATKALDLTNFHSDPNLQNYFCALFKPIILLAVIDIIADNIPRLEALNLSGNRIHSMSYLKNMAKKIPDVKILYLGNNKLREISTLDSLMGLPIIEVVLDGNPLCDKYRDQEEYIREVRKRFPKVLKLDGMVLPPPISFDIAEEHHVPPSIQTFLCNNEGGSIVRQFLEQYFQIFDTDNRQTLLQAYHENAMFSMTMAYPYPHRDKSLNWLNWYTTDNRNLNRVTDSERRIKLLKQGHASIVSFLQEMPETEHDIHSFNVDLTVFTPQMLCLTVSGMFKEMKSGHKVPPIRYFLRTLVIVAAGSGFCIANEELHITNAIPSQMKDFKSSAALSVVESPTIAPAPVLNQGIDDTTKQQMVQAMSSQSGMNLEWSAKCLTETDWDYQKACMAFSQLQENGRVPAEAFVK